MNILITGGSGSFGGYVTQRLWEQGHQVVSVGNRPAADDIPLDLTSLFTDWMPGLEVSDIFDLAERKFNGPVHCLLNHVGITHIDWLEEHGFDDFLRVFQLNVFIPFLFARCLVRRVAGSRNIVDPRYQYPKNPGGPDDPRGYLIVNTCSMAARIGFRACSAYPASKAALVMMTKGWAKEFAQRHPICVYGISPGSVESSGMTDYAVKRLIETRGMTEEEAKKYNSQSPLGRYATHEECWAMYDFVINHAPAFASGSIYEMANATGL